MKLPAILLTAAALLAAPQCSSAGELDLLLDRLVRKNVLAPEEAAAIKSAGPAEAAPAMKFKGDIRLRWQYNDNGNLSGTQQRLRYRLRFGAESGSGSLTAAFGLASGSSADPRSTNQTMGDDFARKNVYLDHAWMAYRPSASFAVTGGRQRNPLWTTNDMLWDADINPEGVSVSAGSITGLGVRPFAAAGYFVLAESAADPHDPGLYFAQPGLAWTDPAGAWSVTAAAAAYGFGHIRGKAALGWRPSASDYRQANTVTGGKYRFGYDVIAPEAELALTAREPRPLPLLGRLGAKAAYAGAYFAYARNTRISAGAEGWIAGFRFGHRKVESPGQWQFGWNARRLERDAWPDVYPDSDFYGGSTGVHGQRLQFSAGLARGCVLALNLFDSRPLGSAGAGERLLQADLLMKL